MVDLFEENMYMCVCLLHSKHLQVLVYSHIWLVKTLQNISLMQNLQNLEQKKNITIF